MLHFRKVYTSPPIPLQSGLQYVIRCSMYTIKCRMYTIICSMYTIMCRMWTTISRMYTIICRMYTMRSRMYTIRCRMQDVNYKTQDVTIRRRMYVPAGCSMAAAARVRVRSVKRASTVLVLSHILVILVRIRRDLHEYLLFVHRPQHNDVIIIVIFIQDSSICLAFIPSVLLLFGGTCSNSKNNQRCGKKNTGTIKTLFPGKVVGQICSKYRKIKSQRLIYTTVNTCTCKN